MGVEANGMGVEGNGIGAETLVILRRVQWEGAQLSREGASVEAVSAVG